MSLRIRFRGGALAGSTFAFDDDVDRIVIGRDPERCDVVLPPEMTEVGREHLAVKRVLARYRLELNQANLVLLDDVPAHDGQELPEVAHLQLGEDGPRLVLQTIGDETVPPTMTHDEVVPAPDLHDVVEANVRRTRGTRRGVLLTFAVLAVLVGVIVWVVESTGKKVAAVSEEQARVRGMLDETTGELERMADEHRETTGDLHGRLSHVDDQLGAITPDLSGLRDAVAGLGPRMEGLEERVREKAPSLKRWLNRAEPSVYVVMLRDERDVEHSLATAFVVGEDVLATNAHVAEFFERVSPGGNLAPATLFVRSPGEDPRDHEVTGVRIHPGYQVFVDLWGEYRPTGMSPEGRLHLLRPAGAACDVALLEVAEGDGLADPLSIAPRAALASLGAGDVVGLVGYPSEDMSLGGVNLAHPKPTTQIAHVTAVTNFFLAAAGPDERLLVQHSLPVTGGASGSPILDDEGHVVGVLSAGNITLTPFGSRSPSAVLVNFAQRADLIRELVGDEADAAQGPRTLRWRSGIGTLMSLEAAAQKGALGFLERYLEVLERDTGVAPQELGDWTGVVDTQDPNRKWPPYHDETFEIPQKGVYVFFAYGVLGQNVNVAVVHETDDDQVFAKQRTPDWYAAVRLSADGPAKVRIRVTGPPDATFAASVYGF